MYMYIHKALYVHTYSLIRTYVQPYMYICLVPLPLPSRGYVYVHIQLI